MKVWISLFLVSLSLLFATPALAKPHHHARVVKHHKAPPIKVGKPELENLAQWNNLSLEQQSIASWIGEFNQGNLSGSRIIEIVQWVYDNAKLTDVDPVTFCALIMHESRFNPNALSSEGAKGLAQVLPKYHYAELAKRSPYNPQVSIEVGMRIYKEFLDQAINAVYFFVNNFREFE